ncbi:helix-turn-helix domain-containing protein [Streptomyces antimycoticus]|uniref:helix-turn-helix domain-containing protein n=1 Tax=Streptomyces antimycoticus TaxID=68175 RepID=UPI00340589D2
MTPLATSTRYRGDTVDLVAVGRYLTNRDSLPPLSEAEQEYTARALTHAGCGSRDIARRLGIAERTITRWRHAWATA